MCCASRKIYMYQLTDTFQNANNKHTNDAGMKFSLLWFLFNPRINLSPFTKDFRGEEHYNESID